MAFKFTASVRLTHTYIDQFDHLDQWGEDFDFKGLGARVLETGNGYDEGSTRRYRVIGSKTKSQDDQVSALSSFFGHSGCTHEYDCCGCESVHASVRKVRPGIFSVLTQSYFNY